MPYANRRVKPSHSLADLTAPYVCPGCSKRKSMIDQPASRFSVCLGCNTVCVEHKDSLEFIRLERWAEHAANARLQYGGAA
jgi:hypothetical protein